jgi:uncharacterized protein (TIGR03437 family)
MNQNGFGQAAVVNPGNGLITNTQNPAHPGDVVSIYCTGLGAVDQPIDNLTLAPNQEPLPRATGRVGVIIGSGSAEVLYAGLAPGFVGLYQINTRIPAGVSPGDAVPIQVSVDNFVSNGATIAIR